MYKIMYVLCIEWGVGCIKVNISYMYFIECFCNIGISYIKCFGNEI